MKLDALAERALRLTEGRPRTILGVTGPPGAGKTVLAEALVAQLNSRRPDAPTDGPWAAYLPMDGFHLADVQLERLRLRDRKGAPETFDSSGYLNLLQRVARAADETVYAPAFERELEQPIAASIAIVPSVQLVITEGNYLLSDEEPWSQLRPILTECWYLDVPGEVRRRRLINRHQRFGKSGAAAAQWVERSDERNAVLVAATRERADLLIVGPSA